MTASDALGAAPIIREVFERRAQGAGPRELGRFLEASHVATSRGSRTWSPSAIHALLSNRVYLGELSYGRDQRYVNPAAHEPIVDLALWIAAQNATARRVIKGDRRAYLLSGLIRCATCGYGLQGTKSGRNGTPIYRCTASTRSAVSARPRHESGSTVLTLPPPMRSGASSVT